MNKYSLGYKTDKGVEGTYYVHAQNPDQAIASLYRNAMDSGLRIGIVSLTWHINGKW